MKRILFYPFAGAACVLPLGCMHTVISGGGNECWSPGDGRYHVGVSADGAGGRAYTDLTDKRIDLLITSVDRRNEVSTLLSRELRLRAADLAWRVRWQGSQLVHVTFTDDQPVQGASKRVVGAYWFAYDAAKTLFAKWPNDAYALRTAPAVTLTAPPPSPAQPSRQAPPSLSFAGGFANSEFLRLTAITLYHKVNG